MYKFKFNIKPLTKDNEKIRNSAGYYYLSDKYKEYEQELRKQLFEQLKELSYFHTLVGPIQANMYFSFPNDKIRRDILNYTKSFADAFNGILYKDDSQIDIANVCRCYKEGWQGIILEICSIPDA